MGKKKIPSSAAKRTKPAAKPSLDRTERIQRGNEVMERIRQRIAGIEKRRNPSGLLGQDRPITQVTRKKYEEEEISRFAAEKRIDEAALRVDVQLAMLMAAIEDEADKELKAALLEGRIPLTESALRNLHPLTFMSGARIVEQLQALRESQI